MVEKKVVKIDITKKEAHRNKLLEYMENPANPVLTRNDLAQKVLGTSKTMLYKLFPSEELNELEWQALNNRRKRYALKLHRVDAALFDKAIEDKDVKAIELIYKKFEGWNPTAKIEVNAGDQIASTLEALSKRLPD